MNSSLRQSTSWTCCLLYMWVCIWLKIKIKKKICAYISLNVPSSAHVLISNFKKWCTCDCTSLKRTSLECWNGSEMLNTPLNVVQCYSVIQNASNGVICAAHFHWPRGFIHKKHTPCCMLWESPAQLSLSLLRYKRGAPLSITPWHFAPPPLCLQLIHTRNMLTLPFMVFLIFPNFVSIHCCSLGQNCQLKC